MAMHLWQPLLGFAVVVLLGCLCTLADADSWSTLGMVQKFQTELKSTEAAGIGSARADGTLAVVLRDLDPILAAAAEQYKLNVAARLRRMGGRISARGLLRSPFKAIFLVPLYPCPLEGRLGQWGDGGKWVCLAHREAGRARKVAVSVGSNGETSFEEDVFRRLHAVPHTLDFTLNRTENARLSALPFLHFHMAGLSGRTEIEALRSARPGRKFFTFKEMLQVIGEQYVDILKVDCEGCEFGLVQDLASWYTRSSVPIGQLLLEAHWVNEVPQQLQMLQRLEGLGFRMFHSEVNAYWGHGYELAFVHERLVAPRATP